MVTCDNYKLLKLINMENDKINIGEIDFGKLNAIMFDMLIDVLATNSEILQRLNDINPIDDGDVEDIHENRKNIIQYLKEKYSI